MWLHSYTEKKINDIKISFNQAIHLFFSREVLYKDLQSEVTLVQFNRWSIDGALLIRIHYTHLSCMQFSFKIQLTCP